MQWVDPASLQLIMDIADIPGMKFLLFIGAYRSNEVGKDHPLSLRGSTN
jgi:predicted ATPase